MVCVCVCVWLGAQSARPIRGLSAAMVLAMLAHSLLSGCSANRAAVDASSNSLKAQHSAQFPAAHSVAESNAHFLHDAGDVLAGATVSHTFEFRNPFPEVIHIANESDIRNNCGCSAVVPEKRVLQPDETTLLPLKLKAAGQAGTLRKGVEIVWTSANGTKHPVRYDIRANVTLPFEAQPSVLVFSETDVAQGSVEEIVLESRVPIDWSTLTVASNSQNFEVVDRQVNGEKARFTVRCLPSDDVDDYHGLLLVRAHVRADSPRLAGESVSLAVAAKGRRAVDLAVSPQTLLISLDSRMRRGEARCLLRGRQLMRDPKEMIQEIACEILSNVVDGQAGELVVLGDGLGGP